MGQASRRRKGKGSSRSSTPTPSENAKKIDTAEGNNDRGDKNSPGASNDVSMKDASGNDGTMYEKSLLVLTSEKRRGIYECDYCHSDISQQPRIRCAVCSDFDLCLDCFATTDHSAMMARIKAATQTQTELTKDGIGATPIVGVAISSAAANHEAHHKYRVCDSTRYPIFPTGRIAAPETQNSKQTTTKKDEQSDVSDKMSIEGEEEAGTSSLPPPNNNLPFQITLSDDPKTAWTAEEDLRLIDAISTHGLGNWLDIGEAIGGQGSVGKTAKRCMERYLDDFLGRYGHILPQWTIVDDTSEEISRSAGSNVHSSSSEGNVHSSSSEAGKKKYSTNINEIDGAAIAAVEDAKKKGQDQNEKETGKEGSEQQSKRKEGDKPEVSGTGTPASPLPSKSTNTAAAVISKGFPDEEEGLRTSKRRSAAVGILGVTGTSMAGGGRASRKKCKGVATESLTGYDKVWHRPYLPKTPAAAIGNEVARDQSCKAELAFVKSTLAASSKKEADKIRQTWIDTKLGRIGSPTVLPPRPHDAVHLLGSELAGFMPRRGDFDVEWENDAEAALADMEFIRGDKPEDKELKLKVLQIYCEKLDEREKRKKFVLNRHLYDYRKYVQNDLLLPSDERDLIHRMRLFERFHTPDEHKKFIEDILKAKRLRKEIAKLQMYRRIGIRSLAEAEIYELDKDRRQFHKKLEGDAKVKAALIASGNSTKGAGAASTAPFSATSRTPSQVKGTDSLWKQYRTNDRKKRRNSSRFGSPVDVIASKNPPGIALSINGDQKEGEKKEENEAKNTAVDSNGPPLNNQAVMMGAPENGSTSAEEKSNISNIEDVEPDIDVKRQRQFNLSNAPCRDLLSRKELALCDQLHIYPVQYLEIKKVLIHESLVNGLLDKDSSTSGRRTIVKIDVERRGNIVEFLVRAGWITRKLADIAMRVVTPQPS